ncbi:MAG: prepilin-type N-terminal cleavage/methylation domain-containing protein [Sulfurimonas sp.]|nr:prepilin-type N-terminal cleavage/methylation domain-containing protein [Sulfurimonas sp.]
MRKSAFTLIELLLVIVIIGILSKFGIELLFQAYNNFIFSNTNNTLQSQSEAAVETIASKLMYRIKDSTIARYPGNTYEPVSSSSLGENATVLEWIGADMDGFRGDTSTQPLWSGIIDLRHPDTNTSALVSPETNTSAINNLIIALSDGGSGINDAALYFVGSDSDVYTSYGWGGALETQSGAMHPIHINGTINQFVPVDGLTGAVNDFSGVDVYEYYQLAWTAYAVELADYNTTTKTGTLKLHYNYQPWRGESYTDGNSSIIMENVSTFRFTGVGSIIKIQVCVKTDLMEEYSLCKDKTVF